MEIGKYIIRGIPNRIEYQKNENGLFTVDIKDYIVVDKNGKKYKSLLRIPNAKISVNDNSGVIYLNMDDINFFNAENETKDNTIFELILPKIVDESE